MRCGRQAGLPTASTPYCPSWRSACAARRKALGEGARTDVVDILGRLAGFGLRRRQGPPRVQQTRRRRSSHRVRRLRGARRRGGVRPQEAATETGESAGGAPLFTSRQGHDQSSNPLLSRTPAPPEHGFVSTTSDARGTCRRAKPEHQAPPEKEVGNGWRCASGRFRGAGSGGGRTSTAASGTSDTTSADSTATLSAIRLSATARIASAEPRFSGITRTCSPPPGHRCLRGRYADENGKSGPRTERERGTRGSREPEPPALALSISEMHELNVR